MLMNPQITTLSTFLKVFSMLNKLIWIFIGGEPVNKKEL